MDGAKIREQKIFTVEALRGIASLAVVLYHLSAQCRTNAIRTAGEYGWLGVEIFFVISGFIIPYALSQHRYDLSKFPRFILRRIVRLEPPYIVSILLAIAVAELASHTPGFSGVPPSYSASQIASHLFYLIPLTSFDWILPVYWSLAYEFAFYLTIGVCFSFLFRKNILYTFALATAFSSLAHLVTGNFDSYVFLFVIGIAGMRYYTQIDKFPVAATSVVVATILVAYLGSVPMAIAALSAVCVIVFVKIPKYRALQFLGAISYSLYLTHTVVGMRVINIGKRFGDGAFYECALLLLALAASIGFAWIFHRLVEQPATNASRLIKYR